MCPRVVVWLLYTSVAKALQEAGCTIRQIAQPPVHRLEVTFPPKAWGNGSWFWLESGDCFLAQPTTPANKYGDASTLLYAGQMSLAEARQRAEQAAMLEWMRQRQRQSQSRPQPTAERRDA